MDDGSSVRWGDTEIAVHGEVQYLEKDGMGCLV